MNVAVCFNLVPPSATRGEEIDRIAEAGSEQEARAVAAALRRLQPDLAFSLCEAFWGDSRKEMNVAALFDLLGITYTGAPPLSLGLTQDKARTKDLLSKHQLPTPKYCLVKPAANNVTVKDMVYPLIVKDMAYPLIVKPRWEDASQGIT